MKFFPPILALLFTLVAALPALGAEKSRPNIIFILADDLGWSDLNCYGNEFHETPNIDRLAEAGMRFTNFHTASPVCSPTRASILTGLYAERLGMTQPACHIELVNLQASLPKRSDPGDKLVTPKSTTRLDTSFPTLAKALQAGGYHTAHLGKWHLGLSPYTPLNHGFDEDIPAWHMHGPPGSYLGPRDVGDITLARGEHLEDRMAEEAVKFIEANRDHPFFLNYWAFSVHSPYVAKSELIEKYRDKAKSLPPDAPHRNPLYAAMVESLDEAVGRILDAVERAGIADRTIIVFTSDNGPETVSIADNEHEKWSNGDAEIFAIPITSNAPYKGGKGSIYEGGTRVPCIVVSPGQVKPGSVSDAPFSSVDFFPTLLQMAGLPAEETPVDGISQVPALLGERQPRDTLYGYWPNYPPERLRSTEMKDSKPAAWVQHDGYKLVCYFHDAPDGQDRNELYDLSTDPAETNDLSGKNPERVANLRKMLSEHHARTGALLPYPNVNYKPPFASPPLVNALESHKFNLIQDVSYAGEDRSEKMDLYIPEGVKGQIPVILYIHGGGWTQGDKAWGVEKPTCEALAKAGYAVASINYKLNKKGSCDAYPQNIYDCKTAVRFLRKEAKTYGLDPNRIAVAGASAGGHLAMIVAYTPEVEELNRGALYPEQPVHVSCVINLFGISDVRRWGFRSFVNEGLSAEDKKRVLELVSPITHLKPSSVPTLVIHGTKDPTVPLAQSEELVKRLEDLSVPHQFIRINNGAHAFPIIPHLRNEKTDLVPSVTSFLNKYLK